MKVIKSFPEEMDKKTSYRLMNSPDTNKMTDADGSTLYIKAWVIYTDADYKTGEEHKVLAIMTTDGDIFATISPTFMREFEKIMDHFDNDVEAIKVITGSSKNGRQYVICDIA